MTKFEEYAKKLNIPSQCLIANLVYAIKQNNDTECDIIIYEMYKEAFEAGQNAGKDWIPVTEIPDDLTHCLVKVNGKIYDSTFSRSNNCFYEYEEDSIICNLSEATCWKYQK